MQVGKWAKRLVPFVALMALLAQGTISFAGKRTTTTLTKAEIVDALSVDSNVILSQGDGKGTESANAYQVYANLHLDMTPEGCNNHAQADGEPIASFTGNLVAQNVAMRLRVQTSAKADAGKGESFWNGSARLDLDLGFPQEGIAFDKKGVYKSGETGGVGGNPWIYIRFKNAQGQYDTDSTGGWILVGRCVQGGDAAGITKALNLPGRRFMRLASSRCTTEGSTVSFEHRGGPRLKGQVALANQRVDNPTDATHYNNGTGFENAVLGVQFQMLSGTLPDIAAIGNWAGGNPAFGAQFGVYDNRGQFVSGGGPRGDGYGPTIMMGRCKDLVGTAPETIDWSY